MIFRPPVDGEPQTPSQQSGSHLNPDQETSSFSSRFGLITFAPVDGIVAVAVFDAFASPAPPHA